MDRCISILRFQKNLKFISIYPNVFRIPERWQHWSAIETRNKHTMINMVLLTYRKEETNQNNEYHPN